MHLEIAEVPTMVSLLLMTGDEKTCVIDKAHVELYGRETLLCLCVQVSNCVVVFPMYFSMSIYLELLP